MITCEEYQLLDELLQAHLLKLDGILLMIRKTRLLNVELYSLHGFYVEVFFDKKNNEPLYVKSFEDGTSLNIYLEAIVIDAVFERIR